MLIVGREMSQRLQAHTFCCFSSLTIRHMFLVSKLNLLHGDSLPLSVLWLFGAHWHAHTALFSALDSSGLLLGVKLCWFALVGLQLSGCAHSLLPALTWPAAPHKVQSLWKAKSEPEISYRRTATQSTLLA